MKNPYSCPANCFQCKLTLTLLTVMGLPHAMALQRGYTKR